MTVDTLVRAGAWHPWLIWPILGGGLGVLGHAVPVRIFTQAR